MSDFDYVMQLGDEIADLRELCHDLWRELNAETGSWQRREALLERMRELEVDA